MTGIRQCSAFCAVGASVILSVSLTFADDVSGIQLGTSLERIDQTEAQKLATKVRSAFKSVKFGTVRLALQHQAAPRVADTTPGVEQEAPVAARAKVSKRAKVARKVARKVGNKRRVRAKSMQNAAGDNQVSGSLLDDAARLSKRAESKGSSGDEKMARRREQARARLGKQNRGGKRLHALPRATSKRRKKGEKTTTGGGSGFRGGTTGPGTGPGASGTGTGAGGRKTGSGRGQRR